LSGDGAPAVSSFLALPFFAFFSTTATGPAGSLGGAGLSGGRLGRSCERRVAQAHTSPALRGALQTSQANRMRPMRRAIARALRDCTPA
jgi:hypothetical protein